jgi:hypothetical protein
MEPVSLAALCDALRLQNVTHGGEPIKKTRIEKWISLDQFLPLEEPETGKVRAWAVQDVARLIAFVRLLDAGCKVEVGKCIGRVLGGFPGPGRFVLIAAYDRPIVKRSDRAELDHGWGKIIDEENMGERHRAFVCKASEVVGHLNRSLGVIAIFVLDLDQIQRDAERVMKFARRRTASVRCERRSLRRRSKPMPKSSRIVSPASVEQLPSD